MNVKDTDTNPLAAGDVIAHNKNGRARLVEDQGDGKWTAHWLTGKYAGQTREIQIVSAAKSPRMEMAPRPEPVVEVEAPAVEVVEAQGPHTRDECEDLDSCTATHQPTGDAAEAAARVAALEAALEEVKTTQDPNVIATAGQEKPKRTRKPGGTRKAKRDPLPEGTVTLSQLAALIVEKGLYQGKAGTLPTQIHWYVRHTDAERNPWPGTELDGRKVVTVEAGLKWWAKKDELASEYRTRGGKGQTAQAS